MSTPARAGGNGLRDNILTKEKAVLAEEKAVLFEEKVAMMELISRLRSELEESKANSSPTGMV